MKSVNKSVAVIGGGASGVFASIMIKKAIDCKVTIFEKQNRILKKVLQTGNGMCNITNASFDEPLNAINNYNTNEFIDCITDFNLNKCIKTFKELGLLMMKDDEGRYYPYSRKANSVCDVLLKAVERSKINVLTDTEVTKITKLDKKFVVEANGKATSFDYVIVSSGGKSAIPFQNKMYQVLKGMGLSCTEFTPALVGFRLKDNVKAMSGIRLKCNLTLISGAKKKDMGKGEIIFKDDGISGIVVMEASRYFDKYKSSKIEFDLLPEYNSDEIKEMLSDYYSKFFSLEDSLCGILPKMVCKDLVSKCKNISEVSQMIKHYQFGILDTYSFENSQVTRGGINCNEVNPNTFESNKVKDLYLIGECLNVDGTCGGYNLHFAWASAYAAAKAIVKQF